MITADTQTSQFRFTGWHMLACMIAFFGVIITVNFTMAYMASGTWTGLVVKNSYVASQKFNGELKDAQLQAESGIRSRLTYADGELVIRVSNRDGTGILPSQAEAWIGRPAFEQQDRILRADCQDGGLCVVRSDLKPGLWAIRFLAVAEGRSYRRDARLLVNSDGTVEVD